MISEYFDKSFFANPVTNYVRWLSGKVYYQLKNWGKHLRINYGSLVRNCTFGKYNWIGNNNTLLNCHIGDYTYIAGHSMLINTRVGKYCSIAMNVKIAVGKHPTSVFVSTHPSTYSKPNFHSKKYIDENKYIYNEHVEIGNDVWIGANAVIVDGVIIADGAVIAANSVVTKNVGEYQIVGGIPAMPIRKRFADEKIEILKEIKWWDKDEEWMQQNIESFWSVDKFIGERDKA